MLLDYEDEFTRTGAIGSAGTSKQSVIGAAGTAIVGGRVKDFRAAVDPGAGECIYPYIRVPTALVGATGGVQVDIVAADDAALATNPVVLSTRTVLLAEAVINSVHAMPALRAGAKKRYLGVKMTPLGAAASAGELIVGLTDMNGRPQNGVNAL
jgi:hypothetical protein